MSILDEKMKYNYYFHFLISHSQEKHDLHFHFFPLLPAAALCLRLPSRSPAMWNNLRSESENEDENNEYDKVYRNNTVQFETLESEGLSGDTVKPVVTTAAS